MHCGEGLPSRTAGPGRAVQKRLQLRARRAQVEELLERGVYDMKELAEGGWLTALRYEDEVIADLKKRTGGKASKVRAVRRGSLSACAGQSVKLAALSVVPPKQPKLPRKSRCKRTHVHAGLCRLA